MRKKSYDDIYNLLKEYDCILLSREYLGSKHKLEIKCKCGNIFSKTMDAMNRYKKYMCNECSDSESRANRRTSYSEVKRKVEGIGYSLLTSECEYKGSSKKIKVMCDKGHIYDVDFYSLYQSNRRCPMCYNEKTRKRLTISYENVLLYIQSIGYELLTCEQEYKDTKSYIMVRCDKGHIYRTRVNTLRSGKRCKTCSTAINSLRRIIPYEERKKYVESFGYEFLVSKSEYGKTHEKYKFKCDKGHTYIASLSDFQQGCRCPICRTYKGEKVIAQVLDKYSVSYISQYKFDDCIHILKLPFDFYLPKYNVCIEYDGKQHYQYVHTWGGMEEFNKRKIRDSIKNEYCRDNGIELIRIPYYEFENIENILLNKLNLRQGNTEVN